MIRVIAWTGYPATGKSTLMQAVIPLLGIRNPLTTKINGCRVDVETFQESNVMVLGRYSPGDTFSGTDKLAMNVQPAVQLMLLGMHGHKLYDGWVILFEGDRLFNGSFLDWMDLNHIPWKAFALTLDTHTLALRHAARADTQNATWLAGRTTKVDNLITKYSLECRLHANPADTHDLVKVVLELIRNRLWNQ